MSENPRHFLQYWRPTEFEAEAKREKANARPLSLIASAQLKRLHHGDIVWITTIVRRQFTLCGRFTVDEIVPHSEIFDRLGSFPEYTAKFYGLSSPENARALRRIDISSLANDLVFLPSSTKLELKNGRVNPQQLQTIRQMDEASAALIQRTWDSGDRYGGGDASA